MRQLLLAFIIGLGLILGQTGSLDAQGVTSLMPGSDNAETSEPEVDLIEALREAAEQGVGIVVIDSNGTVVGQTAPPAIAAENVGMEHSALMKAQERVNVFRKALIERLILIPNAFNEVIYILRAASPDGTIMAFVNALGLSLLMFALGWLFEWQIFNKRIARRFVVERVQENPQGYAEKMPFLVRRFAMNVVGILVSLAVAYVIGYTLFGELEDSAMQFTVTLINIGYFCCRVFAGLWRMILSPFLSQYRIPTLQDRDAKVLHRWMWMMGSFDICAILFGMWIGELGLNYDIYALVAAILSAIIVVSNIVLVVVNHRAINYALRLGKPLSQNSLLIRFLCRVWAPAVFVYVIFAWFELTYDLVLGNPSSIPLIAGAYGILISIIVVYGIISYLIERGFARARAIRVLRDLQQEREAVEQAQLEAETLAKRMAEVDAPEIELEPEIIEPLEIATALVPEAAVQATDARIAQVVAEQISLSRDPELDALEKSKNVLSEAEINAVQHDILAAQADAEAHGLIHHRSIDTFEALARRVAGILAFVAGAYAFFYIWDNDSARMVENTADRLLDTMVIIFIGYVIYHAFRIWIDSKIADETGDLEEVELGDEGGGSSSSRLATLLPLFRNFMLIVVVVTIILILLMEFGVNVGPLFAGAGIVGIAIGFGSQALVRDVFAGAFFLFDDAFRKGEYLDVGGVKGTVEKISVRSFQLRHHLGYLHTIPFGELQVMTNFSRDWVMMKLPLRVTYDTDVEAVRKMIKKLGVRLLDDPVIGENFIQPLKSQGVIEMQDSAMIIRVKFMTKPGDQWLVRKRVYEEIRELFALEGIKFAHREVTVRLADGKVEDLTEVQKREVSAAALEQHGPDDEMPDVGGDDR